MQLQQVVAASTANVNRASAPASIDGVTLTSGNRVLLKNQSIPAENGVYVFSAAGSALVRASDANTWDVLVSAWVWVFSGALNANTSWLFALPPMGMLDTTTIDVQPFRNQSRSNPRQRRLITDFAVTDAELRAGTDPDLDCVPLFYRALRSGEKIEIPAGVYYLRSAMSVAPVVSPNAPKGEDAMVELKNLPENICIDVEAAAGAHIVMADSLLGDATFNANFFSGGAIKVWWDDEHAPGENQYVRFVGGFWDASLTSRPIYTDTVAPIDHGQDTNPARGVTVFDIYAVNLELRSMRGYGGGSGTLLAPETGADTFVTTHACRRAVLDGLDISGFVDVGVYLSGDGSGTNQDDSSTLITNFSARYCGQAISAKRYESNIIVSNFNIFECKNGIRGSAPDISDFGFNWTISNGRLYRIQGYPILLHNGRGDIVSGVRIQDFGKDFSDTTKFVPASPNVAAINLQGCVGTMVRGCWAGFVDWVGNGDTGSVTTKTAGARLIPLSGVPCSRCSIDMIVVNAHLGFEEGGSDYNDYFVREFRTDGLTPVPFSTPTGAHSTKNGALPYTPALKVGATTLGSYSSRSGQYLVQDGICYVWGYIDLAAVSGTGAVTLTLPKTAADSATLERSPASTQLTNVSQTSGGYSEFGGVVLASSNVVTFYERGRPTLERAMDQTNLTSDTHVSFAVSYPVAA